MVRIVFVCWRLIGVVGLMLFLFIGLWCFFWWGVFVVGCVGIVVGVFGFEVFGCFWLWWKLVCWFGGFRLCVV